MILEPLKKSIVVNAEPVDHWHCHRENMKMGTKDTTEDIRNRENHHNRRYEQKTDNVFNSLTMNIDDNDNIDK